MLATLEKRLSHRLLIYSGNTIKPEYTRMVGQMHIIYTQNANKKMEGLTHPQSLQYRSEVLLYCQVSPSARCRH